MSTFVLRALNDAGIEAFRDWLARARAGDASPPPRDLCASPAFSQELSATISVDPSRTFGSQLELGTYFEDVLEPLWSKRAIDLDRGLWTALALIYFDVVCPVVGGARKIKSDDRYILASSWDRVYRHLLRTPFVVSHLHGKHGRVALSGKPYKHSEASEQLTSRQQILLNVPLFRALDALYVTADGKLKTGASSKAGGSLRRLGKVLKQYDLTYDMHVMDAADILALLPREFDRFKAA